MLRDLWPQIEPDENPIDYVTNGVHVPTFLAPEWHEMFDRFLGAGWSAAADRPRAAGTASTRIPDHMFWSVRQYLKSQMLHLVRHRMRDAARAQPAAARRTSTACCGYADPANPNVLTIGFARRFATYKRATLLFEDLDWLRADRLRPAAAGAVHLRRQGASRPTSPGRT